MLSWWLKENAESQSSFELIVACQLTDASQTLGYVSWWLPRR